ncbi:hypothetical protein E2C01_024930 [Portunus trituberculatus]|uniref:Uncharacterized protein n=1 Tax=Portunus trituberculatus TaxID=210409 RepID=A0A5B7EE50_PORTR|nr:hypothetical protein [Portunus trituberculatus]
MTETGLVQERLQRRETMGSSVTILRELQYENEHLFRNYMRMNIKFLCSVESGVMHTEARGNNEEKHCTNSTSGGNCQIPGYWVFLHITVLS